MLKITDSDIFKLQDDSGILTNKISNVLRHGTKSGYLGKDIIVLNTLLEDSIQAVKRLHNEPIMIEIINAINEGTIVLVNLSMDFNIPKCLPFVRYVGSDQKQKVLINLTNYVTIKKNNLGEDIYSVSAQRLYPFLICAYLSLTRFTDRYTMPAKALEVSAFIWASMFNKVLCRVVALATNKERYDAFMYFAMKYYCINIVQTPEQVAEDIARGYLLKKSRKEFMMLDDILMKIEKFDYKPYRSFSDFCHVLFNNEITNLRVNLQRAEANMNIDLYMRRFVDQFKYEALFSLAAFPYFLFAIMNAAYKTRVVNDMAFQDILADKDYNVYQMINALI